MTQDRNKLSKHLEDRAAGRATAQELAFDPQTGELRLVPRAVGTPRANPDAIVVDQIAEEGFFHAITNRR